MRIRARILAVLATVLVLGALVPSAAATQPPFRDVRRADDINLNLGTDVCGGPFWGWNLTGSSGAAGDNWISVFDTTPADSTIQNLFGSVTVWADVLIRPFNNSKGGGVLARFNEGSGKKGLALTISDAGNTDRLNLGTVSGDSTAFTTLGSANLNGKISECAWYQVELYVGSGGPNLNVYGRVYSHTLPTNPNSSTLTLLGTVSYSGPPPTGIDPTGQVGIFGRSTLAVEDTTIANFAYLGPD